MTSVSWNDARAFCDWLTKVERAEGIIETNQSYRLPSDREWSVAVGLRNEPADGTPESKDAKIAEVYPWGQGEKPPNGFGNYAGEEAKDADWPSEWGVIAGYADKWPRTSPVGSFGAKHGELCDLGGNVWEWCQDQYRPTREWRVLRGGFWCSSSPGDLRSSYRGSEPPGFRSDNYGFRVVLSR